MHQNDQQPPSPTKSYEKTEAQQDLARRHNLPVVGGIYRHYKGGLYVVIAVSIQEETGEPLVTYRSNARGTFWTRTLQNFQEHVDFPDADSVPRFRREDN
jgi:hypothetical protein